MEQTQQDNDNHIMEQSEAEIRALVAQAKTGDSDSIGMLFDRFADRIFRFLRMRVRETETAEDLTQTVFLEMIESLPRYKERENAKFSTWLFQIARFRLIDHYRKQRKDTPIDDVADGHPALTVPAAAFEFSAVDRVFTRLPERYQTVLHLRFREEYSPQETARILGISTINVRVIQHRALKELRRLLNAS